MDSFVAGESNLGQHEGGGQLTEDIQVGGDVTFTLDDDNALTLIGTRTISASSEHCPTRPERGRSTARERQTTFGGVLSPQSIFLIFFSQLMVGATGIEPVTPTV
jgi:hypothetical protein